RYPTLTCKVCSCPRAIAGNGILSSSGQVSLIARPSFSVPVSFGRESDTANAARHLGAAPRVTNSREKRLIGLFGRGRRRDGAIETNAAEARQLERRLAQIDAGHEPEQVHLDALNPAKLEAGEAPQARLDPGAAVGEARIGARAEVAADRVRRQHH